MIELHKKRVETEKKRMQGRKVPSRGEEKYERNLMLVATKGVVQLFNTV